MRSNVRITILRATLLALSAVLVGLVLVLLVAGIVTVASSRGMAVFVIATGLVGTFAASQLAGHHMRNRRALVESEYRARQITNAAQLAVVGYDADGRITSWNPAATRTFGWSARDAIGQPLDELVVPRALRAADRSMRGSWGFGESRDALARILRAPFAPGVVGSREALARHRDGHEFHVEVMVSNIGLDVSGERVAFLHDISARRQAEEARSEARERLVEANEQLRRADAIKSDFLAMASHELRTPLTSISGFSKTMLERWDDIDDGDKRSFVDIIDQQADRLGRLVADLLTLGRIERRRLELKASDVDPVAGVRRALRDLDLEVAVVERWGEHDRIRFDEDHFQQVLLNLLCNAVAYGADPIEVTIEGDLDGGMRLEVRDGGDGVPESFVPYLFDRFAQAPEHARRSDGSVGLGLSIVYGLVEANGGYVSYQRLEPQGSCFRVSMPASATITLELEREMA